MVRAATGFVALLLQGSAVMAACSCQQPTLDDLIDSDRDIAVFTARVMSVVAEKGKPSVTRLQVSEVIRGKPPRLVEMSGVTVEDIPCGVDFRPGEVRTLAAFTRDGQWLTDMCHIPRL